MIPRGLIQCTRRSPGAGRSRTTPKPRGRTPPSSTSASARSPSAPTALTGPARTSSERAARARQERRRRHLRAAEFDSLTRRRARRGQGAAPGVSFVRPVEHVRAEQRVDAGIVREAPAMGRGGGRVSRGGHSWRRPARFDSDSASSRGFKPLIWTGDLNVCHREIDVTHPRFFATQKPDGRKGKPPPSPRRIPATSGSRDSRQTSERDSSDSSPPTRSSTRTDGASGTLRTR